MDAEAVRQLRMGLEWVASNYWLCWLDHIVLAGSYCWIVWYKLNWIVSYRIVSYRIVSTGSGNIGFYALAGYCMDGTDGKDGLDRALVVRGWGRRTLATAGTGAPPWAPEKDHHRWIFRYPRFVLLRRSEDSYYCAVVRI